MVVFMFVLGEKTGQLGLSSEKRGIATEFCERYHLFVIYNT